MVNWHRKLCEGADGEDVAECSHKLLLNHLSPPELTTLDNIEPINTVLYFIISTIEHIVLVTSLNLYAVLIANDRFVRPHLRNAACN